MQSPELKRSVVIAGHKSSVSLESEFWTAVREIAGLMNRTPSQLIDQIDKTRKVGNLSSATRLFVLAYYQERQPASRAGSILEDGR